MRFKKEDSLYSAYLFLAVGLALTVLLYVVLENSQKNNFKEKLELILPHQKHTTFKNILFSPS